MKKNILILFGLLFVSCLDGSKDDCLEEINVNVTDCEKIFEPVCGCNNETYVNACTAEAYSIFTYSEGSCN